ncbi:MAG: tetraacyldisaccharide 4'-kinase [Saprospiraceae bacterium]|nr:tetraacyldisaccharide 4'-kinase [Saprospiraceae bacterium]
MVQRFLFRILLSPLALLYGIGVSLVNLLYDTGFLRSSKFNIPVISVGNLSIGGAGKTPHIEYLLDLLSGYIYVATLSRGYKRLTRGFRYATYSDTALTVGDEPMQYRMKYRDVIVAVSESRAYAIPQILKDSPQIQLVLLDDAFQHRAVKPGLNLLLTAYDAMFTQDFLLPAGRLREWRSSYKRADVIVVTKCPETLGVIQKNKIIREISPLPYHRVFFTRYEYDLPYSFYDKNLGQPLNQNMEVILLSAIANTSYLMQYVDAQVGSVTQIEFADHHLFDKGDVEKIIQVYRNSTPGQTIVLTTEKDAMQ